MNTSSSKHHRPPSRQRLVRKPTEQDLQLVRPSPARSWSHGFSNGFSPSPMGLYSFQMVFWMGFIHFRWSTLKNIFKKISLKRLVRPKRDSNYTKNIQKPTAKPDSASHPPDSSTHPLLGGLLSLFCRIQRVSLGGLLRGSFPPPATRKRHVNHYKPLTVRKKHARNPLRMTSQAEESIDQAEWQL